MIRTIAVINEEFDEINHLHSQHYAQFVRTHGTEPSKAAAASWATFDANYEKRCKQLENERNRKLQDEVRAQKAAPFYTSSFSSTQPYTETPDLQLPVLRPDPTTAAAAASSPMDSTATDLNKLAQTVQSLVIATTTIANNVNNASAAQSAPTRAAGLQLSSKDLPAIDINDKTFDHETYLATFKNLMMSTNINKKQWRSHLHFALRHVAAATEWLDSTHTFEELWNCFVLHTRQQDYRLKKIRQLHQMRFDPDKHTPLGFINLLRPMATAVSNHLHDDALLWSALLNTFRGFTTFQETVQATYLSEQSRNPVYDFEVLASLICTLGATYADTLLSNNRRQVPTSFVPPIARRPGTPAPDAQSDNESQSSSRASSRASSASQSSHKSFASDDEDDPVLATTPRGTTLHQRYNHSSSSQDRRAYNRDARHLQKDEMEEKHQSKKNQQELDQQFTSNYNKYKSPKTPSSK